MTSALFAYQMQRAACNAQLATTNFVFVCDGLALLCIALGVKSFCRTHTHTATLAGRHTC